MIRFIINNWLRNRKYLILLLIGLFTISLGLSILFSLSEINNVKINKTINTWKPSYDIFVSPPDRKHTVEDNRLLEANYLNDNIGGINDHQFNQISSLDDVEIAAPMAVIGYGTFSTEISKNDINLDELKNGIYKATYTTYSNNGIQEEQLYESIQYYFIGSWYSEDSSYGVVPPGTRGRFGSDDIKRNFGLDNYLLVGVDPESEAQITGIDNSATNKYGRYFDKNDYIRVVDKDSYKGIKINFDVEKIPTIITAPLLSSDQLITNQRYTMTIERLDIPFDHRENINKTMEEIKEKGGAKYLDTINQYDEKYSFTYNFEPNENDKFSQNRIEFNGSILNDGRLNLYSTSAKYIKIDSPYYEKWPFAYKIETYNEEKVEAKISNDYLYHTQIYNNPYRKGQPFKKENDYRIIPKYIGAYETDYLTIEKDPITNLPLDSYRPAMGKLVLDKNGEPVNPPIKITPNNNPFGYMSNPPHMLTTLEAARAILGEEYISSIRVKVKGIDNISEPNQQKVKQVAKEIEQQTGLMADVVYGASPQPVIVYVPENGDKEAVGWIEQVWMKLGTSTQIYKEFTMGYTGIFYSVALLPFIYIIATYFISYLSRKKEIAILLASGWRHNDFIKMFIIEATIIGSIITLLAWGIIGITTYKSGISINLFKYFLIGIIAFLISLLGTILPSYLAKKITPYDAMKTGEIASGKRIIKTKNILTMSLTAFLGRIQRSSFSISSIAIPTMLLVFFIFVTYRLGGILYTSWLGQYVAMGIGITHYIGIGVAIMLSILITAQIIWQNVQERRSEIALLKALGWENNSIRKLIILEGLFTGVLAAILGILLGLILIYSIYRKVPINDISLILLTGLIPILMGILGSILPAQIAAKQDPLLGLKGKYITSKKQSKILSITFTVGGVIIIILAIASTVLVLSNYISTTNNEKQNYEETQQQQTNNNNNQKNYSLPKDSEEQIGNLSNFTPNYIANESKGTYELDLNMDNTGLFNIKTTIEVENLSQNTWKEIQFYFIPNVFTKENKDKLEEGFLEDYATVKIEKVTVNNVNANYELNYDKLTVNLNKPMKSTDSSIIEVSYNFTVPEKGMRFTKNADNYYLAQWYPMLATYRDGKWNKENYIPLPESYHTDHSNFTIKYTIPEGYTIVSSSNNDPTASKTEGTLVINNAKEVYVSLLQEPKIQSEMVDGTEVRVINGDQNRDALTYAVDAFNYYNQNIGKYPYEQLDVIIGGSGSMEYPGIITITTTPERFEHTIAHEIGHQWFYGIVSNDPFYNGWLDEGITELATSLYKYDKYKDIDKSFDLRTRRTNTRDTYSNLPLDEYETGIRDALYDKPVLELWDLFSNYGGIDTAEKFLRDYYSTYFFEELDSVEFIRFTKAYFNLKNEDYFIEWLK